MNFQYIPREGDICTYNGTGSIYAKSAYNGYRLKCCRSIMSRNRKFLKARFIVLSPIEKMGNILIFSSSEVFWAIHRYQANNQ